MELRSDVRGIIHAHLDTLKDNRGRESPAENFVHFVAPILLGLGYALWQALHPTNEFPFGNLLAGLAVLFGFFLALTTFVFSLRKRVTTPRPMSDLRAPKLIDELFINCEFAVIISGTATFLALAFNILGWHLFGGAVLVALLAQLFVLVMMCLKRLDRAYEIHKEDLRNEAREARASKNRQSDAA